ncbi:MAG: LPXTG cell wall anchor domain-containing protein [Deltaproteobacteria bacterium]|nr:LPXTG cell wall anchor domain-containing protein [Deltaproteobacteria bacterium]
MSFNNNVVFVLGLALVVAGYLVIRKRLKESLRGH